MRITTMVGKIGEQSGMIGRKIKEQEKNANNKKFHGTQAGWFFENFVGTMRIYHICRCRRYNTCISSLSYQTKSNTAKQKM
jgi:hypothetical protein